LFADNKQFVVAWVMLEWLAYRIRRDSNEFPGLEIVDIIDGAYLGTLPTLGVRILSEDYRGTLETQIQSFVDRILEETSIAQMLDDVIIMKTDWLSSAVRYYQGMRSVP
jgi:hypothetical protein